MGFPSSAKSEVCLSMLHVNDKNVTSPKIPQLRLFVRLAAKRLGSAVLNKSCG